MPSEKAKGKKPEKNPGKKTERKRLNQRNLLKAAALAVLALAILITFYIISSTVQFDPLLREYGLVGLFVAAVIANATLFVVVPLDIVVLGLGKIFHPFVLGAVVGMGATIGETTAYVAGLGGRKALDKLQAKGDARLKVVQSYVERYGAPFILIGSLTPFPFDLVGIACGLIRFNIFKFFVAAFAGKFLRYTLLAYAGIWGLELIKNFFLV